MTLASSFPKACCVARNTPSHILVEQNFSSSAKELRRVFDSRFADPRNTQAERFVWDYWHVPDQYTAIRTPAYNYFDQKLYLKFHKELVLWGRRTLGCWDISPPWMSCYVEGCKQELHSDVPHGPWAFVFSLTPPKNNRSAPSFSGGETLILKPEVLNYWQNFSLAKDREQMSFVDKIQSIFNQLTVFDPRYPHGVTEVRGTHDPSKGRLVIHGWFTEPKTYLEGPLKTKYRGVEKALNQGFEQVVDLMNANPHLQGTMSLQLKVTESGKVQTSRFATCNLLDERGLRPLPVVGQLTSIYKKLQFPTVKAGSGATLVTIPLIVS